MKLEALSDFTPVEDMVLVGLLREIVQADGEFSAAELAETNAIRTAMGEDRFTAATMRLANECPTRAALKEAAVAISRPESRKAIFGILEGVAESDGVDAAEEKPLRWLASWWHLG